LQLHNKPDYIVSLKSCQECVGIAEALQAVDKQWLANRYGEIDADDYDKSEEDFEYTWSWFRHSPEFISK